MKRVLVLGSCGSGKSTFARALGRETGLPVIHMDAVFWQPGWVEPDRSTFLAEVARIAARERWIFEGNYSKTFQWRMPRCDTIIFLDMPHWQCVRRAIWRSIKGYGRTRPDMAPNCPEKFDFKFFKCVYDFRAKQRDRLIDNIKKMGAHAALHVLDSDRDVSAFLQNARPSQTTAG